MDTVIGKNAPSQLSLSVSLSHSLQPTPLPSTASLKSHLPLPLLVPSHPSLSHSPLISHISFPVSLTLRFYNNFMYLDYSLSLL